MMIVFAKNKRRYCRLKADFWAFCGKKKKKSGFNRRLDAFFSGGQSPRLMFWESSKHRVDV
jgi:hypothetical protein